MRSSSGPQVQGRLRILLVIRSVNSVPSQPCTAPQPSGSNSPHQPCPRQPGGRRFEGRRTRPAGRAPPPRRNGRDSNQGSWNVREPHGVYNQLQYPAVTAAVDLCRESCWIWLLLCNTNDSGAHFGTRPSAQRRHREPRHADAERPGSGGRCVPLHPSGLLTRQDSPESPAPLKSRDGSRTCHFNSCSDCGAPRPERTMGTLLPGKVGGSWSGASIDYFDYELYSVWGQSVLP